MVSTQTIGMFVFVFVFMLGYMVLFNKKEKKSKLAERIFGSADEVQDLLRERHSSATAYGNFHDSYFRPYFEQRPEMAGKLSKTLKVNTDTISKKIIEAKMENVLTSEEVLSMKLIGMVGMAVFMLIGLSTSNAVFALLGVTFYAVGSFMPIRIIESKIKEKRESIERGLPDFLDLLKSVTEAGLVIQEALSKVTIRMKGALAEEFMKVMVETKASGGQWRAAMENMAFRNDIDVLSDVVSDILITYEKGTPISDTLEKEAKMMRQLRNSRIQEKAKSMSIKLIIPMVIFSFLPLLIMMVLPMLLQMSENFK